MRYLSLKDIQLDCEEELCNIHRFGNVWVVKCDDGYWQTKSDSSSAQIVWYEAKKHFIAMIMNKLSESDQLVREEEEDRNLHSPIEYIAMEEYTGLGYQGQKQESIHDGFDI